MPPVRLGLVGCGRMGRAHLAAAAAVDTVDIVAVCDPFLDVNPVASTAPPRSTFDRLVASGDVEALLIAAPTPEHERLTAAAIDYGKHVLCEKPLTLDPAADRALAVRASDRGVILQVGFWRRFAEPYLGVRELLTHDRIGPVTGMRAAQWDAQAPSPAFCDPQVSGGIEIDCGVHEFDLARWLLGAHISAVTACSACASPGLRAVGDVDTVFALARLDGHRMMAIDLTRTAGHRDSIRTEIIGARGSIVVEFVEAGTLVVRDGDRRDTCELAARDVIAAALARQLHAFAGAIVAGRLHPDAATAHDSCRALLAARAMRDARDRGIWLDVTQ